MGAIDGGEKIELAPMGGTDVHSLLVYCSRPEPEKAEQNRTQSQETTAEKLPVVEQAKAIF